MSSEIPEFVLESHNPLDNSRRFLLMCDFEGPLTQEVEYLPFKQRVAGSSPVRPTIPNNPLQIENCKLQN